MARPPVSINNDLLRFDPGWFTDIVPWWWLKSVDQSVLNQLATVQLEHQKVLLDAQRALVEKSLEIVKSAK